MNMDTEVYAVCACGKDEMIVTLRKVKNAWPFCSCKQSMKVTNDVPVSARNRMGDAGSLPGFVRRKLDRNRLGNL